jgi:hypothetical protein
LKTYLNTVHEEKYSDGDRTLGVLLNYNDQNNFKESFIYVYREGMYIFFDTMIEMAEYLLYGEKKMKRAYVTEADFDNLYDAQFLNGKFSEILKWVI